MNRDCIVIHLAPFFFTAEISRPNRGRVRRRLNIFLGHDALFDKPYSNHGNGDNDRVNIKLSFAFRLASFYKPQNVPI